VAGEPAHDGDRHRDAGGGRHPIVRGERHHVRAVAHHRLGHVVLPVGIRGERHRGVEREVRRHLPAAHVLGVPRQERLQPQERVAEEPADEAEQQQRERVRGPRHVLVRIDAEHAIEQPFHGHEHRGEERAIAGEDARHVDAHRLRQQQDQPEEQGQLQDTVAGHGGA